MSTHKTYETWSLGIHRIYGIRVENITSDLGDRPTESITLISEELVDYPTVDQLNELLAWTCTYDSKQFNRLCDELDKMTGINTEAQ